MISIKIFIKIYYILILDNFYINSLLYFNPSYFNSLRLAPSLVFRIFAFKKNAKRWH